jgi:DNA-binding CsgD family transcriptional regulator
MSSGERFDLWQFAGRFKTRPASQASGLAFEDFRFGRMTTHYHSQRRMWTPPFANNDKQLQQVLILRAWRYSHHGTPLPANADWRTVNRDATSKALQPHKIITDSRIQQEMYKAHVRAIVKAGGYMQLQSSIAWKRWRLGEDSVQIAEELGISPGAVRIILQRLRDIGRMLGYDCGLPHHSRGSKEHSRRLKKAWRRRKARYPN